jgi:Zn-dependent M28 family amino/carboxypeptidase
MPILTGPALGCVAVLALGVAATAASAQAVPDTTALERALAVPTARAINAHLRFLADDLLEGRAPGTRGAAVAARYIQSQFEAAGLEPGAVDGSFFQRVRLVGITPSPSLVVGVAQRTMVLEYIEDFVAWPAGPDPKVIADGEIVFVGYGIEAPEWAWDDFKLQPLTGKILMILVNDPGLEDPSVFRGREMTYFGRWTYKLEQAARLGAVGAFLVHTDESATYPWSVVQNSWSGEQVQIEGRAPQTLRFGAWITQDAARRIATAAGIDYDLMLRRAMRRDFRPVTTNAHAIIDITSRVRRFKSVNVIGRLGSDRVGDEEAVVLTAHYDHRGIGIPVEEDSIYNGAQDNASGVAGMVAAATGLVAAGTPSNRSVYFVATTAEESGLLGAEAFVRSPPVPLLRTAAVVNLDLANVRGATRDIVMLGAERSSLGELAAAVAEAEGLTLALDTSPEAGGFFRSDHFPFARAGIPVLSIGTGIDFVDRPPEWGRNRAQAYMASTYHQPSDEYRSDFQYEGLLQQVRAIMRLVWALAETPEFPVWNEDSEFRDAGDRLRAGR